MKTKVTALCDFRYGSPKAKKSAPAGTLFEYDGDEKALAKLIARRAVRMPTEAEVAMDAMRTGGGSRARTTRTATPHGAGDVVASGRGSKPKDETSKGEDGKKADLIG